VGLIKLSFANLSSLPAIRKDMIDFKELPKDGVLFEQLIREIFLRNEFETHWTGVGADGGRDLIVTEVLEGKLSKTERKWLVNCKHFANAKRNKSVNAADIGDFSSDCNAVGATGFILVCSTQPSAGLVKRLEETGEEKKIETQFWDSIEIEKRLTSPKCFALIHTFFPKSALNYLWKIYNAYSPSFWAANYKDYFLYMSSRDANTYPELSDIETMVSKLEEIPVFKDKKYGWDSHYLRIRAVYYDDKHESYSVFVDYLFPRNCKKENIMQPKEINKYLKTGQGLYSDGESMWKLTSWDVRYVPASTTSDHFHLDHKNYYEPFMKNYESGISRSDFFEDWLNTEVTFK
jgi:uncharacterized protein YeaO (DUF488 family)